MREPDRVEWERRPFREKSRFVCKDCNSGWMSGSKMPISRSSPAITGEAQPPLRLEPASQVLAATWALKTTLVLQGTQSDKPIAPPDHFAHLRAQRQPPSNVTVWIGSHYRARFDPINTVYVQKPLSLEPLDDKLEPGHFGYVCFLAVGGLSFLVIGAPLQEPCGDHLPRALQGGAHQDLAPLEARWSRGRPS